MRILMVGDVVASPGREYIYNNLRKIKKRYSADYCIINAENAAQTNGITVDIANSLLESGADVLTLGNHTFANREVTDVLEDNKRVIRPINYPPETVGEGYFIDDLGYTRIAVINAMGRMNMEPLDCPFHAVERLLKEIKDKADLFVVDFHAETTSEKLAFGNYFDGKINIIAGTHTHVQTVDLQVLPGGTAYITDLGMTGVRDSVLGVKKEIIIDMYYTRRRFRFEKAEGETWFSGAVFDIDAKTGKINSAERIYSSGEELCRII